MGLNIITSLSFTFVVASQLIHTRTHSLYPFLSLSLTHTHTHKHTLSPTIFHSLIFYKSLLFSTIIPALYPSKKLQVMKTSDRPWSKIISLSLTWYVYEVKFYNLSQGAILGTRACQSLMSSSSSSHSAPAMWSEVNAKRRVLGLNPGKKIQSAQWGSITAIWIFWSGMLGFMLCLLSKLSK